MHNPEASPRRPAPVPRRPHPAHTGQTAVADRSAPRPERRPKADSVRTEEPAGAVRHAKPFARSGRIAAPQTGRSARRGALENQPLPRSGTTRPGRSGTGSSPPRDCGPQSGEGGERNGRRSFGGLRNVSARPRHARRPFGIRRPVGGKPAHDGFEPRRSEIASFLDTLQAPTTRKHDRRKASLAHSCGKAEGVSGAYELLSQVHAQAYA